MKGAIRTRTGLLIPIANPMPYHINLYDIAHGLSNVCRWAGQCRRFYSVAEHCINVARICEVLGDMRVALYGLLHDAHEAYIGDIPTPFKIYTPEMQSCKRKLDSAIYAKIGLEEPSPEIHNTVKEADSYCGWFEDHVLHHGLSDMTKPPEYLADKCDIYYFLSRSRRPQDVRIDYLMFLRYLLVLNGIDEDVLDLQRALER